MPKAGDLKRGMVVDIEGVPHIVKDVDVRSPSSRGAATLYKVRFNNLQTGQKLDESFKGDDLLKDSDCARLPLQYSYSDGAHFVFMSLDDYSQYEVPNDELEELAGYLTEGLEGIYGLIMDSRLLSVELPQSVNLSIVSTPPSMKGSSATGRTKPATLSTGIEVQVPEYLEPGELIKVSTVTGKFVSRA